MAHKTLWRCPVCGRDFARQRQTHSCRAVPIDRHFQGKAPWLRELFNHLCAQLARFGPLRIDAVQTGINLIPKHHMGGVRVLRKGLRVGFLMDRRVESPRVTRWEEIGPRAHYHSVHLASPRELDHELLSWLREAYQRAAGTGAAGSRGAR